MKQLLGGLGMALLAVALMGAADGRPSNGKPDVHADVLVFMASPELADDLAKRFKGAQDRAESIRDIFLPDEDSPSSRAIVFDYAGRSARKEQLVRGFLEVQPESYSRYWAQEISSGKRSSLRLVKSPREMTLGVAQNRYAIGYAFRSDLTGLTPEGLRIVLEVPLKGDAADEPSSADNKE